MIRTSVPIIVPYWFACCVLMSTRGIGIEIRRIAAAERKAVR